MRGAQGALDECKKFTAHLKIDTSALRGRWRWGHMYQLYGYVLHLWQTSREGGENTEWGGKEERLFELGRLTIRPSKYDDPDADLQYALNNRAV